MNNQGIYSRNLIKPITPLELGKQKIKPNEVKKTLDMCGLPSISPNQKPLVFLICTISKMPMFSTTTGEINYENIAKFYNYVISNYPYILEDLGPEVTSAEKLESKLQEIYKILETSAKGFDDTLDPYERSVLNPNPFQGGNKGGKRKNKLTKNKKFKIKSKRRLEKKLGKIIRKGKKSSKKKSKRRSKMRSKRRSKRRNRRSGGGTVIASAYPRLQTNDPVQIQPQVNLGSNTDSNRGVLRRSQRLNNLSHTHYRETDGETISGNLESEEHEPSDR